MVNTFYKNILSKYGEIKFPSVYSEISKIGSYINWYLSDSTENFVSVQKKVDLNIIELDIKSAFPTICINLFGLDSPFIQHMLTIQDKKERNIFIATTLKPTGWLPVINSICKMIVLGVIFSNVELHEDIVILEIKKDGCILTGSDNTLNYLNNLSTMSNNMLDYINETNFIFHIDVYEKYIRSNRTTTILNNNNIQFKGMYKYLPSELESVIKNLLITGEIKQQHIMKIYSENYFNIIRLNNLLDELKKWVICSNNKILNDDLKYQPYSQKESINPRIYLKTFLFPCFLALKI